MNSTNQKFFRSANSRRRNRSRRKYKRRSTKSKKTTFNYPSNNRLQPSQISPPISINPPKVETPKTNSKKYRWYINSPNSRTEIIPSYSNPINNNLNLPEETRSILSKSIDSGSRSTLSNDRPREKRLTLVIQPFHIVDEYCYILKSEINSRTYVGVTSDLKRRLRQHNGQISGGAKATRGHRPWKMVAYVSGFFNRREALRFEWRMHHPGTRWRGLDGRKAVLLKVLQEKKWSLYSGSRWMTINWLEPNHHLDMPLHLSCWCREIYHSENIHFNQNLLTSD